MRTLSEWVADETGSELFKILSKDEDPKDSTERAKEELEKGIRPALSTHIPADAIKNYDIILNALIFDQLQHGYYDYSRYAINMFKEEDKAAYRDAHFQIDLQNAFDLGKRLVESV